MRILTETWAVSATLGQSFQCIGSKAFSVVLYVLCASATSALNIQRFLNQMFLALNSHLRPQWNSKTA